MGFRGVSMTFQILPWMFKVFNGKFSVFKDWDLGFKQDSRIQKVV